MLGEGTKTKRFFYSEPLARVELTWSPVTSEFVQTLETAHRSIYIQDVFGVRGERDHEERQVA